MNIIQLIRLILKNIYVVLAVPIIIVVIVFSLTKNLPKSFSSKTIIYTGIGTGYDLNSVSNSGFNFMKNNASFDNLINVIKSRRTNEEVVLRLMAQHMALEEPNELYISKEHFYKVQNDIFDSLTTINRKQDADKIYEELKALLAKEGKTFLYKVVHGNHPYYSTNAISGARIRRISNSDLVEINFSANDPGICQNILHILNETFIRNYKIIKKGETNDVVAYFENQILVVKQKLDDAEKRLLNFNKSNRIINYYEQTKHISKFREDIELLYQQELMQTAAAKATIIKIEDQLNRRNKTLIKSANISDIRKELSDITTRITILEIKKENRAEDSQELLELYNRSNAIKNELTGEINEIGIIENTTAGLSQQDLMTKWLDQIILHEESNARLAIYQNKINDLKRVYAEYAPLGATMKRIERQISVTEREYLAILKGLNDSKNKQRSIEMSTNLDIIDPPFYPVVPAASKRSLFIMAGGMVGLIIVIFLLIVVEYFDSSIKNHKRLSQITDLEFAGAFPNLTEKHKNLDMDYIFRRSIDEIAQKIKLKAFGYEGTPINKPFISVIFSTKSNDGKTTISKELHNVFIKNGFNVVFFNYKINDKPNPNDINSGCHFYNFENLFNHEFSTDCFFENLVGEDYKELDFIFLEIPPIQVHPTPTRLLRNIHFALLVARANRPWDDSETYILGNFKKNVLEKTNTEVLANGVKINELESLIGEIPKKRSAFRQFVKRLIKFQFKANKTL